MAREVMAVSPTIPEYLNWLEYPLPSIEAITRISSQSQAHTLLLSAR
jgi:hypothetical protein